MTLFHNWGNELHCFTRNENNNKLNINILSFRGIWLDSMPTSTLRSSRPQWKLFRRFTNLERLNNYAKPAMRSLKAHNKVLLAITSRRTYEVTDNHLISYTVSATTSLTIQCIAPFKTYGLFFGNVFSRSATVHEFGVQMTCQLS